MVHTFMIYSCHRAATASSVLRSALYSSITRPAPHLPSLTSPSRSCSSICSYTARPTLAPPHHYQPSPTPRRSAPAYSRTMSISPLFTDPASAPHVDVATFANYYEVATEHIHLEWTIDWKKRTFGGSVELTMGVRKEGVESVMLDAAFLDVGKVEVDGEEAVCLFCGVVMSGSDR